MLAERFTASVDTDFVTQTTQLTSAAMLYVSVGINTGVSTLSKATRTDEKTKAAETDERQVANVSACAATCGVYR